MAIPKMYALKREGGKLTVEMAGGDLSWARVAVPLKRVVQANPNVQSILVNPGLDDPFIPGDFEVSLTGAPTSDVKSATETLESTLAELGSGGVEAIDAGNLYLVNGENAKVPFSPVLEQITTALSASEAILNNKLDTALINMGNAMSSSATEAGVIPVTVTIKVSSGNKKAKVINGLFHSEMPRLMKYVQAGQHCYIPGPPGVGKSHAGKQIAEILGDWYFGSLSCGPMTTESKFWGGQTAEGFTETALTRAIRFAAENPGKGAIYCLDEMDYGNGGVITTMNSLLANGFVFLPSGEMLEVGRNFIVLACANTYGTGPNAEFAGANKLNPATLDRFAYVPMDTDEGMEATIVASILDQHPNGKALAREWLQCWYRTRNNVKEHGLKVFVTMRGAIEGAQLLVNDIPLKEAWNARLGNKLPQDVRNKVLPWTS